MRARVLFIVALFALLTPLGPCLYEAVSVDTCLDRGGSYNYRLAACDFNEDHPCVPFLERYVLVTIIGMVLFLGFSGFALQARRHTPSDTS